MIDDPYFLKFIYSAIFCYVLFLSPLFYSLVLLSSIQEICLGVYARWGGSGARHWAIPDMGPGEWEGMSRKLFLLELSV